MHGPLARSRRDPLTRTFASTESERSSLGRPRNSRDRVSARARSTHAHDRVRDSEAGSGSGEDGFFELGDPAADEVAVAVDVVDAGDGGPELVLVRPGGGEGGLGAGVGAVPMVGGDGGGGVRGVLERIVG